MAEEETVISADNVTVVEAGDASAAIETAQERVEAAEETAAHIAQAAMETVQGQKIEELQEEVLECQQQSQISQSEVEAAHARTRSLEMEIADLREVVTTQSSALTALTETLHSIADRLTPPQLEQSPTPEAETVTVETVEPAAEADRPALESPARRRGLRWI